MPNGNLLIGGSVTTPSQGGTDFLLLEIKTDGAIVQSIAQGDSASQSIGSLSILGGNIVATGGSYHSPARGNDAIIATFGQSL